ncbi:hypothetical protein NQ318_009100 [Aromia moschata]|uniref:Uncharacterized protein n=1 Tax=Aromia moschata TaxID=1265417 RepID=A0AAV8X0M9_9CUCU|nr:hypothetical protein NQ318_009100 [Aromia moschata]
MSSNGKDEVERDINEGLRREIRSLPPGIPGGAELGAELGYYAGVTESYLRHLSDKPEKLIKSLENLKKLLDAFPTHNAEDVDIIEEASKIRAKFKKICAQLKIDAAYPETDNLSF